MKSWATTLIFLTVFGILAKSILPKGEKSRLYAPFRFLLSLLLIVTVFSPLVPIFKGQGDLSKDISRFFSETEGENVDVFLLKRFASVMDEKAKATFPDADFSFEIHTDENKTPVLIKVVSEDKEKGQEIADWIRLNYKIETKVK